MRTEGLTNTLLASLAIAGDPQYSLVAVQFMLGESI